MNSPEQTGVSPLPSEERATRGVGPGVRRFLAGVFALAVIVVANWISFVILRSADTGGVDPDSAPSFDSFYDGCIAVTTLALPAFLGGLAIAYVVRARATNVALPTFAIATLVGCVRPYWHVAMVAPEAVHSALMHYMIHSPLVILAFGWLGAWLGGEFASGRFTFADRVPIDQRGMED